MGAYNKTYGRLGTNFVGRLSGTYAGIDGLLQNLQKIEISGKGFKVSLELSSDKTTLDGRLVFDNPQDFDETSLEAALDMVHSLGFEKKLENTKNIADIYRTDDNYGLVVGKGGIRLQRKLNEGYDKTDMAQYIAMFVGLFDYLAGSENKVPESLGERWLLNKLLKLHQGYDGLKWQFVGHHRTLGLNYKGTILVDPGYESPVLTIGREKKSVYINATVSGKQINRLLDSKLERVDPDQEYWEGTVTIGDKTHKLEADINDGIWGFEVKYKTKTGQEAKPVLFALYQMLAK